MKLFKFFSCCFLVLLLAACGSTEVDESTNENCIGGSPQAIFEAGMNNIQQHKFSLTDERSSTESFLLIDSIQVEISQSGCTQLEQVFTFEFATEGELVAQQGVMILASCMTQLGLVDERTRPLAEIWGPLLLNYQDALASGEQVNLSPLESMQFRYAVGAELTMLELTATQVPQ